MNQTPRFGEKDLPTQAVEDSIADPNGLGPVRPELKGGIYVYANEGFGEFAGFSAARGYRSTHVRL